MELPNNMSDIPPSFDKMEAGVHTQNIANILLKRGKVKEAKIPGEEQKNGIETGVKEQTAEEIAQARTLPDKWFVFDCETYKNDDLPELYTEYHLNDKQHKGLKDPVKIEANRKAIVEKAALDPRTAKVILVGFLDSDDQHTTIGGGIPEKRLLRESWKKISHYLDNGYRMVTFNGKLFDLPMLFTRALLTGVLKELQPINMVNMTNKYSPYHLDLIDILPGGLAEISYLMDESESWVNDGINIGKYYEEKRFDLIVNKNLNDLYQTKILYELIAKWYPYRMAW